MPLPLIPIALTAGAGYLGFDKWNQIKNADTINQLATNQNPLTSAVNSLTTIAVIGGIGFASWHLLKKVKR